LRPKKKKKLQRLYKTPQGLSLWKEQQKAVRRKLLKRILFSDYTISYKPVTAVYTANVNTGVVFAKTTRNACTVLLPF